MPLPQVSRTQIKIHLVAYSDSTRYDLSETAADRASLLGCRAKNGPGGVIPEDVESHILSIKVTAETFCASLCVRVNKRNRFRISYS